MITPRMPLAKTLVGLAFLSLACCQSPSLAQTGAGRMFDRAVMLFRQGNSAEALTAFETAHAMEPNDPTINNWIGYVYLQQHDYKHALEPLLQATQERPDYAQAYTNLGTAYSGLDKMNEAVAAFTQAASLDGQNPLVHYNLGSAYIKLGRYSDAIGALNRAADLNGHDAYIYNSLGYALQMTSHFAEAADAYKHATDLEPAAPAPWFNLGLSYLALARRTHNSSDYEHAIDALQHSSTLDSSSTDVMLARAQALAGAGRKREALEQFRNVLKVQPADFLSAYYCGFLLQDTDRPAAVEYLRRALQTRPRSAEALSTLGTLYFKMKQFGPAQENFRLLTEVSPENGSAWINLAAADVMLHRDVDAASALEAALQNRPPAYSALEANQWLGDYYQKIGSPKRAEQLYRRELEQNSADTNALNGLGRLAYRRGNMQSALHYLRLAIQANYSNAYAHNNLGAVYQSMGKRKLAMSEYRRALEINPRLTAAAENLFTLGE